MQHCESVVSEYSCALINIKNLYIYLIPLHPLLNLIVKVSISWVDLHFVSLAVVTRTSLSTKKKSFWRFKLFLRKNKDLKKKITQRERDVSSPANNKQLTRKKLYTIVSHNHTRQSVAHRKWILFSTACNRLT